MQTDCDEHPQLSWNAIVPHRRHFYFYVLLLLSTMVLQNFLESIRTPASKFSAPTEFPSMITSRDVYPMPMGF